MLPEIILFPEIYLELEKMCCFRKSIRKYISGKVLLTYLLEKNYKILFPENLNAYHN